MTLPKPALATLVASVLAAIWAVAMLTTAGRIAYVYLFVYLEFYLGPVTLVSLTLTVMLGLLSTDRLVLMIRHRVLLQSAHRALGILAVGSLVVHIMTKVAADRVSLVNALVPFVSGRGLQGVYVGLGTIAAFLMAATIWTGIVRARFVGVGRPWMWRALHSSAYASWPFALVHGLKAGRAGATWVTLSYVACVLLVVVALLVRLAASVGRKRREDAQTTGSLKPVGKPVQTGAESWTSLASAARRIAGRERVAREPRESRESVSRGLAPPDPLTDSWVRFGSSRKADSPGQGTNRFAVPEVPLPRAAADRAVAEDPWDSPRRWSAERSAPEPAWDSPSRWSAADGPAEYAPGYPPPVEQRRAADFRAAPTDPPRRRRAEEVAEDAPVAQSRRRSHRYADDDDEAPVVESRRSHRYADDDDEAPVVESRRRTPRYADDEPPLPDDDTPTLVDLASRRARRAETGASSNRSRKKRGVADAVDEAYWRTLRGEAQ